MPGNLGYRVPLILCDICYMIYPTRDRHLTRENKLYFSFAEKVTLKVTFRYVTPGIFSVWRASPFTAPPQTHLPSFPEKTLKKNVHGATIYIPKRHLLLNIISLGHFGAQYCAPGWHCQLCGYELGRSSHSRKSTVQSFDLANPSYIYLALIGANSRDMLALSLQIFLTRTMNINPINDNWKV